MSATSPGSEHFGWARFYDEPEEYWAEQERGREAALRAQEERNERAREGYFREQVERYTTYLAEKRILRTDRLSHTYICHLEWETGIQSGSWSERWLQLREAQQKDEER